jgi:transposase InsO family protein
MIHTDQGSQYTSNAFLEALRGYGGKTAKIE